jgi:hypothetical protein
MHRVFLHEEPLVATRSRRLVIRVSKCMLNVAVCCRYYGEPLDLAIVDAAMWTCTYGIRSLYITAATPTLLEHGVFFGRVMNKLVQTWDIGRRSFPSLARGLFIQRAFIHLSFLFFCFSLFLQSGKASYPFLHTSLLRVSYISFPYTFTFLLYKITWLTIAGNFCVRLSSLYVCGRCVGIRRIKN